MPRQDSIYSDVHAAFKKVREDAGLSFQELADMTTLPVEFLKNVENRKTRPTEDQFRVVLDKCLVDDVNGRIARWVRTHPYEFAGHDAHVRTDFVVVEILDREVHAVRVEHDIRDAVDVANDLLKDHVASLGLAGYETVLNELLSDVARGLNVDETGHDVQVATTSNYEAWTNWDDHAYDVHIVAVKR